MSTHTMTRGTKSAILRSEDITVDNLAKIFKITQSSLYLTHQNGVSVFPLEAGFFSSLDLDDGVTFQVMGDDVPGPLPSTNSTPVYSTPGPNSVIPRFSFSRTALAARSSSPATNPRIYQRTIFIGQLEGERIVQEKALVIQFEESEACVKIITNKVKEALDTQEDVFLTDSQGNLLLDTSGTKGSIYWKQSSRKVFAVKEDILAEIGRRKRRKVGSTSRQDGLGEVSEKIEEVLLAAEGLPAVAAKLKELNRYSEGLSQQQAEILRTSFKCSMCRGVMDSPMLARCCRSLIGCRQCVDLLLQGTQACVKCRTNISREHVVAVAGLSEVITVIKALDEQYSSAL